MASTDYPTVYGLWSPKGGCRPLYAGHAPRETYAKLFPAKAVVVIDACPSANLSCALLTTSQGAILPAAVMCLSLCIRRKSAAPLLGSSVQKLALAECAVLQLSSQQDTCRPHQFLTHVSTHNKHMPPNLWLMCGDSNLFTLARPLNLRALEPPYAHTPQKQTPYTQVHQLLRRGIQEVAAHFKATQQQQEIVVFVYTAATLDVLTAIALCAVNQLIIPAEPDVFSTQAVGDVFSTLYGITTNGTIQAAAQAGSFAARAKRHALPLPRVCCLVLNRLQLYNRSSDACAAEGLHSCSQQVTKACAVEARAHLSTLVNAFEAGGEALFWPATGITQQHRNPDLLGGEVAAPTSGYELAAFSQAYTAGVRNMASAGLASLSTGLPLWKLGTAVFLPKELKGTISKESLGSVIQDMLSLVALISGPEFARAQMRTQKQS